MKKKWGEMSDRIRVMECGEFFYVSSQYEAVKWRIVAYRQGVVLKQRKFRTRIKMTRVEINEKES